MLSSDSQSLTASSLEYSYLFIVSFYGGPEGSKHFRFLFAFSFVSFSFSFFLFAVSFLFVFELGHRTLPRPLLILGSATLLCNLEVRRNQIFPIARFP